MDHPATLRAILAHDPLRLRVLAAVRSLGLPDCWVAAGFLRNAVWDHLHGRPCSPPAGDIDVIWFDAQHADPAEDRRLEAGLKAIDPTLDWSVKNQGRMHLRNGDAPYASASDAMRRWPETATAVAVRLTAGDELEFAAPFGFDDLFALIVRPTPAFHGDRHVNFLERVRDKAWLRAWPLLRMEE